MEVDIGAAYDCLEFSMSYEEGSDDVSVTEDDITAKNAWIAQMCNRIEVDPQEVYDKNFTYFNELASWMVMNYYNKAKDVYNRKVNQFYHKWVNHLCKIFKSEDYDHDTIEVATTMWLDELFDDGYIWGLDVGSILDAKEWDDVCIFDTTPREHFYNILQRV